MLVHLTHVASLDDSYLCTVLWLGTAIVETIVIIWFKNVLSGQSCDDA